MSTRIVQKEKAALTRLPGAVIKKTRKVSMILLCVYLGLAVCAVSLWLGGIGAGDPWIIPAQTGG